MKEIWNWIQIGIGALGGFIGWFFGNLDGLLYTLLVFAIVDYTTGILRAISERKLSSKVGMKGITKKVMMLLLVGIAHMLDVEIIGTGSVLRDAVIFGIS
jgi:toxin secretion/phage lysis holin